MISDLGVCCQEWLRCRLAGVEVLIDQIYLYQKLYF